MAKDKSNRLKKMSQAVENADLKTKEKQTAQPTKIRKHINMPKDWDEAIKNNYGGTVTSYILTALKKQLEQDNLI